MKVDVVMPKLGESITEGTISKWLKKPGDPIAKDEILLEISTDKVESEIPSPVAGVLAEMLAQEGETVEVDKVIARVETDRTAAATPVAVVGPTPVPMTLHPSLPLPAEKSSRFYSPLVLNIARKENITLAELEQIPGTGLNGRVSKKDLLAFIERKKSAPQPQPVAPIPEKTIVWDAKEVEIIPMDHVRRQIAQHMRHSLDTSAHVFVVSVADVSAIMTLIRSKRQEFEREQGFKLTFTPFVLQAAVRVLLDFPRVNSSVDGDNIVLKKRIHLGMAVASESGLIVPVIKNAEEKNFRGLARAVNDLAGRARSKKLKPDDIQGSTFSVTNFGVFGNLMGFPIINQPNVAILGVGAVKKQPVVLESEHGDVIAIRSLVYLTLSLDHRIIDGDLGGRFIQRVAQNLEQFNEPI